MFKSLHQAFFAMVVAVACLPSPPAGAATPSSGTLSTSSLSLTYSDGPFTLSKVVSRRKDPAHGPVAEVVACTSKRPSLFSTAWTL